MKRYSTVGDNLMIMEGVDTLIKKSRGRIDLTLDLYMVSIRGKEHNVVWIIKIKCFV